MRIEIDCRYLLRPCRSGSRTKLKQREGVVEREHLQNELYASSGTAGALEGGGGGTLISRDLEQ